MSDVNRLKARIKEYFCKVIDESEEGFMSKEDKNVLTYNKDIQKMIDEELAKVPQWIPCSERLPEPEVNVLIYQIYKETNPFAKITIGHLHQESDLRRKPYWKYIGYGQDMFHPKIESYHRADFICPGCEYVIAWQPLPQPYTENRKELS